MHNAKRYAGYLLILLGIAALGSFFFIISLPPLGYGVLILAGGYLAFGGLKLRPKTAMGWLGLILLLLGLAALGSFFFVVSLPPLGYGFLVLVGTYLIRPSRR